MRVVVANRDGRTFGRQPTSDELAYVRSVAKQAALTALKNDRFEADDVAQETVLKLLNRWNQPNVSQARSNDRAWRNYVARTARNASYDLIRSEARRQARDTAYSDLPPTGLNRPGVIRTTQALESRADLVPDKLLIVDEIRSLPGRQRAVAALMFLCGASVSEAANNLGIQPRTVRKHMRAARQTLIHRMELAEVPEDLRSVLGDDITVDLLDFSRQEIGRAETGAFVLEEDDLSDTQAAKQTEHAIDNLHHVPMASLVTSDDVDEFLARYYPGDLGES